MGCAESNTQVLPLGADLYERRRLVGVGNHGCCYSAHHSQSKKDYLMKVIDKCAPSALKIYTTSLMQLTHLSHTKIVAYRHIEASGTCVSIVMDYAGEGTLKKRQLPLDESTVSGMAGQLLDGLRYLHSEGRLHYDIKPSNVVVFENEVKLSDYGLALLYDCRLSEHAHKTYREESERYMAPEVYKQLGYSGKSDVWSLGCLVMHLLTNQLPWMHIHPTMEVVMQEITKDQMLSLLFMPFKCSPSCEDFLKSCLCVLPSQRGTAEQLRWHPFITAHYQTEELFKPRKNVVSVQQISEKEDQEQKHTVIAQIKKGVLKKVDKREEIRERKKEKLQRLSTTIDEIKNDYAKMAKVFQQNEKMSQNTRNSIVSPKRFETQPSVFNENEIIIELPIQHDFNRGEHYDKEYFKKPLKLLHKKMRERRLKTQISKNLSVVTRDAEESLSKIKIETQNSHEDAIIDTVVAKQERDRYINEQLFFKKHREEEKKKWEVELKKGADILQKQHFKRYQNI